MNKIKNLLLLIIFSLFLINCTTIKFGTAKKQYSTKKENKNQEVKELDFSYYYKVFGVNITGDKGIVEDLFQHPTKKTFFMFISFPKVGILKTNDYGKTFTSQFFTLSYFNDVYGYNSADEKESNSKLTKEEKQIRLFGHFAVSQKNPNKVIISKGPYIFYSNDCGIKWKVKNIFFDNEKSNIRDIFIGKNEEIIIFTENKIAVSYNWGEKWNIKYIKIPEISFFKTNYITGIYDNSSDTIFSSIQDTDENNAILSKKSYDFLYKGENTDAKTGLYYTKDFGKTWNKTPINIPVALWKYQEKIYGSPIYPLEFYNRKFNKDFTDSLLYTDGKLDKNTDNISDYSSILLEKNPDSYQIISSKTNKILSFDEFLEKYNIKEENNFENIYYGLKTLDKIDYIQWQENWGQQKKTNNFCYEYNPYRMFKLWMGMNTNSPISYIKQNEVYYRIRPQKEFLDILIKYSIDNQIRINSINPIVKKKSDIEFFDPAIDPTGGFPVAIEYSNDLGKTWEELVSSESIKNIIDHSGDKRSELYWYKNIDNKKSFKLSISFGFSVEPRFLVYPADLMVFDKNLLVNLNYFSMMKSYKNAYLIPLK